MLKFNPKIGWLEYGIGWSIGWILVLWLVLPIGVAAADSSSANPWITQTITQGMAAGMAQTTNSPDREDRTRADETVPFNPDRSSDRSEMPPDIQRILRRGKLIVAMLNQDNPPFFMADQASELIGLDAEVARSIAEQLGVQVEFNRSAQTFDQVVKTVYRLDADLAISKLSRTLSRAKSVRFTQPYVTMRQGLLVNRLQIAQQANGRNMSEVLRSLKGKIGVIRGSSYVGFTQKKFPQAEIVEFPTWSAAIDAVIRGDVLATYRDELEVKKIVLSKPDAALQFQTIALTDTEDSIAIALPWDSQHLLAFVNQSLETMQIHHTADSLLQAYAENWKGK